MTGKKHKLLVTILLIVSGIVSGQDVRFDSKMSFESDTIYLNARVINYNEAEKLNYSISLINEGDSSLIFLDSLQLERGITNIKKRFFIESELRKDSIKIRFSCLTKQAAFEDYLIIENETTPPTSLLINSNRIEVLNAQYIQELIVVARKLEDSTLIDSISISTVDS